MAFSPVLIAAGTPIQSPGDLEKICYYSKPAHSPYRTKTALPTMQPTDGYVRVASAAHWSNQDEIPSLASAEESDPSDLLKRAIAAKKYTVDRGAVLMREYNLHLDPPGFVVHPYNHTTGQLTVDFSPTSSFLNDEGGVKWAMPTSLDFQVSETQAEAIQELLDTNQLYIEAHVQIASREAPERAFCEKDEDAKSTLDLILISATFRDNTDDRTLAHAVTQQYDRAACNTHVGQETAPHIEVTDLASTGNTSLTPLESITLQLLTETELHFCYMNALQENAATQGALVMEFSISPNGRLSNSGVSIDALNNQPLIQCAIETLDTSSIPRPEDASTLSIRMNLTFSRR